MSDTGRVISTAIQFLDGFTKPSKEVINSMRKMGNEAVKAGKQIQNAGKSISNVGSTLTRSVTAPLLAVGAAAVKVSAEFEAQMSRVQAIAGASSSELKQLTDQAVDLGASSVYSAKEVAVGMENMASAGFSTKEIMASMSGMLNLAASSGEDLATSAEIAASTVRGFGLEAKETAHVADVLAKTAATTNAAVADTGDAMKYAAPVANALKISLEETAAAIGIMSNAGIKGSQAGTTIRGALTRLVKPTKQVYEGMDALGVKFFDNQGQMKSMSKIIEELRTSTKGLSDEEKNKALAQIFGTEALSGMLALVNSSPGEFDNLTKALKNSDGAAMEMANTMMDNTKGAIEQMKGSIETAGIKLGNILTPNVTLAAKKIGELADKFSKLTVGQQGTIVKIAVIAAAIGPVLLIFGKMVTTIGTCVRVFGTVTKVIANFGGIVGVIASPAGIIIGILIGISIAAILIIKNWDKAKGFLEKVGGWFKTAFEKSGFTVDQFKNKFLSIASSFSSIFGKIGGYIEGFSEIFNSKIRSEIVERMPQIKAAFEGAVKGALVIFDSLLSLVDKGAKKFDKLLTTVENVFKNNLIKKWCEDNKTALELAGVAVATITALIIAYNAAAIATATASGAQTIAIYAMYAADGVAAIAKGALAAATTIWTTVAGVATTVTSGLGAAVTFLTSPIALVIIAIGAAVAIGILLYKNWDKIKAKATELGQKLKSSFKEVQTFLANWGKSVTSAVKNAITNMITGAAATLKKLGTVFTSAFNKAANAVPALRIAFEIAKSYITNVISTIKGVIGGLKTIFSGITTFISGVFTGNWSKAWEGIRTIFKGVFQSLVALCKTPINAVISIINGAINGVNKMGIKVPDWVPLIGGNAFSINIPNIPMLYKGTDNWRGGAAVINDRKGEIVDLPKGSRVYPHDKSIQMARKEGAAGSGKSINITINKLADKLEVRNDNDIDKIAEAFANKLLKVSLNMGVT